MFLKSRKKELPLFIDIFSFLVLLFITMAMSEEITINVLQTTNRKLLSYLLLSTCLCALFSFTIVLFMHCIIDRRPWKELGINIPKNILECIALGCGIPFIILFTGLFCCLSMGAITITSIHYSGYNLIASLLLYIIAAFIEEILMRGYLLNRLLRTRLNSWVSIFIISCIFAFMHLANPGINILSIINLVISGILFGILFMYTKNILYPLVLHFMWNWLQGSVFGFKVSGENFFSSFITLSINGNELINGGSFGFEASIVCTVLLLIATIMVYLYLKKRYSI